MAKMKHPDSDLEVEATPDSQGMYASQGWVRVDGKPAVEPDKK